MMQQGLAALLLLVVSASGDTGCRRQQVNSELGDLERRYAADSRRIDGIALDLDRLSSSQRLVVATYEAAKREWSVAKDVYSESSSQSRLAAGAAERAAADYEAAERYYRVAALAMVVMSAGSMICGGKMSTAAYRRALRREGMSLDELKKIDVDHVLPRSRGGIDHPLNYQPLSRSLNRSLGNKMLDKFLQAPLEFVTGAAVSALGVIGGCH